MSEKKFSIARSEKRPETGAADVESFVTGMEPETTKTFRIPVRLSRELRIHAAKTGQTEKEILIRLISDYLESKQ